MGSRRKGASGGGRSGRDARVRLLLWLFPARFRDEFGSEMRSVLRADRQECAAGGGSAAGFWWRTVTGMLRAGLREQLDATLLDVRYALRTMRKQPLFTATAAVSLAVGIAGTTTVVAVFDATFVRPIPGLAAPERLINVHPVSSVGETFSLGSHPNFRDLQARSQSLEDLAGFNGTRMSLRMGSEGEPEVVPLTVVSTNYFELLGLQPRRGRFFAPEEDRAPSPVVVISSWFLRERLADDPDAIGRDLVLNGTTFTIIGVAPPGFRGHFVGFHCDLFVPLSMSGIAGLPEHDDRSASWLELVGRLREGASLEQAAADMDLQARNLAEAYPEDNHGLSIWVEPMTGIDADLRGGFLTFLIILFGVSSFVLLIGCVNVANMLLGRVAARSREMALRQALGAPRRRLARQLLTENLVLAILAGGLGTWLAVLALRGVRASILTLGAPVSLDIPLAPASLAAAVSISALTALLFGTAPALAASRGDLTAVLNRGSGRLVGGSRLRGTLVVAQVVLSVVVLACAGLFLRALQHSMSLEAGFDATGVHRVAIAPALMGMASEEAPSFFPALLERVSAMGATEAACLTTRTPLGLGARFFPNPVTVELPGREPPPGQDGFVIEHTVASHGCFRTLGIPVIEGRGLRISDDRDAQAVAVVNETFARRFHGGRTAVGSTLRIDGGDIRIVGVVRDSKYRTLEEAPMPFLYLPFAQQGPRRAVLLARAEPGAGGYAGELRAAIREHAPYLPLGNLGLLQDQVATSRLPQKIAGAVATALGAIGLFLTAVGLYGVLGTMVSRRAPEIGVRMSLGARPADVQRLVLRQGLTLMLLGVAVGVPLALLAGRGLSAFLFGLSPLDPLTYLGISTLVVLTGLLAGYLPASRAARIDPLQILRSE